MFEDFDKKPTHEGRGRMGASMLISGGIFAAIVFGLGAAIATARAVVRRHQRDVDVSFAALPTAPKPKPMIAKKTPGPRKAIKRTMTAIKEIPQERPEEAEGELAIAEGTGEIDGVIQEKAPPPAPAPPPLVEPPPPPAPEQVREVIRVPRFVSGCPVPEVRDVLSTSANAATIRIEVQAIIDSQGKVTDAKVTQSHPLIPDELVLSCLRAQVFEPAQLPDGTAVPYPHRKRWVFRPQV
jgi:hypothetical protein